MRGLRTWAAFIAAIAALFALSGYLDHTHRTIDLTANNELTLTEQTRNVVRGVRHKVTVTALVGRDESGRPEAAALLQRYKRLNGKIKFRVLDPADAPTVIRRLQMDPSVDLIAAEQGSRVARAPTITEQDITTVISQVIRNVSSTLCIATGHGERSITNEEPDGLAAANRLLTSNGYTLTSVNLLTASVVPKSCDGLLLAAPTTALGDAQTAIAQYLASNGRVIVLADPESTVDLSPLLAPYKLSTDRGIVIDANDANHLPDDRASTIVPEYHSKNPIVRRLPPTLYPGAEAIVLGDITGVGGLATDPIIQAGRNSYLERHPEHDGFTRGEDRDGPITLGATADLSRVVSAHEIARSRVVAIGDVDFASNNFIATAGNARLLVQAVDWVTQQEDLVPLNANIPAFRPLDLTHARTRYALVLSAGVIPGLFLLAGGWVWAIRRSR